MSQIASPAVYPNPARQAGIGLALVALLIGVYFLTFNGFAISSDEWFLFDATESLARRGNLTLAGLGGLLAEAIAWLQQLNDGGD